MKTAMSSASLILGSVLGKLLMDFSSSVRRSLASMSIVEAFKELAMLLFLDENNFIMYVMTQSGGGTVGGTRTFCCFVKKD